jgi:hypothetical protein
MIEFSKHKDLKTVRGQVLTENFTMLAMCAELGLLETELPKGDKTFVIRNPWTMAMWLMSC